MQRNILFWTLSILFILGFGLMRAQQNQAFTLILKSPGCEVKEYFNTQTDYSFDVFKGSTASILNGLKNQKGISRAELTYTAGDYQGFVVHFNKAPGFEGFKTAMKKAGVLYIHRMHLPVESTE